MFHLTDVTDTLSLSHSLAVYRTLTLFPRPSFWVVLVAPQDCSADKSLYKYIVNWMLRKAMQFFALRNSKGSAGGFFGWNEV